MKVGGLGFCHTVASGMQNSTESKGDLGGFNELMAAVLTGMAGKADASQAGQQQTVPGEWGLTGLFDFLSKQELAELEEGMHILEDLIVESGNLLDHALVHLDIQVDEIESLLAKWGLTEETTFGADMDKDDILAFLSAFVADLAGLSQKDLAGKLGKEEIQAIKAVKLIELMAKYSDADEGEKIESIKESLRLIGSKLEVIIGSKQATDQIQSRFTRLAAELNILNGKNVENQSSASTDASVKAEGPGGTIPFLPHLARAEQLTIMLQNEDKPFSAEQLMKQFESILSKARFMNSGGMQKLFFKLYPEHLGSLRVELFQKDQTMMARIITTTSTAKEILESQINGLKQAFAAQNISVDRIEVSQQTLQQERFLNKDSQQQQQRQPEGHSEEKQEEHEDFRFSFEEALLNTEI
ncbi:flagellar hook-length control protein FliK [Bacillus sp. REN3]|uniref:flagellar hook-length control protein FliK n=1 Tax=Bacillus sp. REN3 TaxID=2802440 RepID=UPI001AEED79A